MKTFKGEGKLKKKSGGSTFRVEKDKPFPLFEDKEWYSGKFIDHETKEGLYGPSVILKFKALGGEMTDGESAVGREVQGLMNAVLSPKQKLYAFVQVLAGREPEIDEVVDLKSFYGKKVMMFIENRAKKGTDKVFSNVTAIRERKKKA